MGSCRKQDSSFIRIPNPFVIKKSQFCAAISICCLWLEIAVPSRGIVFTITIGDGHKKNFRNFTPASAYVGRLAPAPTGALHLGNARTFLVAWLRARLAGGRLLLRLEDLDHPKMKPGAAIEAYRDLSWLGLDWDAGPDASFPPFASHSVSCGESCDKTFVQSHRTAFYASFLDRLRRDGRAYPCACSRKDLESFRSAPNAGEDLTECRYPGTCRDRFDSVAAARAVAGCREIGWRFRLEDEASERFVDGFFGHQEIRLDSWSGDFLIARGKQAGYQLAVVADDSAQGVTEVVRGADLLPSTGRQLALYRSLDLEPPAFFHVPLVTGPDGRRLAKRHGDSRLSRLRNAGRTPERVLGWLAKSLRWQENPGPTTLAEICAACAFDRIPRVPIMATPEDLAWLGMD
jgi:glutamyl-tRNA synthetase